VTEPERLDAAEAADAWRALERRLGSVPLAVSWDWTEIWLGRFGPVVPHRFVAIRREGEVAAIALLCEERVRKGPFRLLRTHVGTAGEPPGESVHVEYNGLLGDLDARAELARAIAALSYDELRLDGFAEEDARLFGDPQLAPEPCPRARLDGDVIDGLRSSTRQKVRRSLRGFGEVETEWAETPERALAILDELIDLHQRRWREAGEAGAFAGERFKGFHHDLVERLLPSGRVVLFRVAAEQGTVGCLYSFVEGERVLFYQSGFGSFGDNKLKPGLVAHALCMQACADHGLREYNFLAGESRYKRELSDGEDTLVWGVLRRRSPKLLALEAARRLRR
jgi:CelD/BcsL family acetyltransferase involved in cellulose biosynthesis